LKERAKIEPKPEPIEEPSPTGTQVRSWDVVKSESHGWVTERDDLAAMVAKYGDRSMVVKDVNGGRSVMPASAVARLLKTPGNAFISEVFLTSGDVPAETVQLDNYILNYLPVLRESINRSLQSLSAEAPKPKLTEPEQPRAPRAEEARTQIRTQIDEAFGKAKFTKAKVHIDSQGDEPGREATVEGPSYKGLIVHRKLGYNNEPSKTYGISHVQSGKGLGLTFATQKDAKIAAVRFADAINFDRPESEITADSEGRNLAVRMARAMQQGDRYANDPYAPVSEEVEVKPKKAEGESPTAPTVPDLSQLPPGPSKAK
jgi:hypothetical protein